MSFSFRLILAVLATVATIYGVQAIDASELSVQAMTIIFVGITLTSFISPIIVPSSAAGATSSTTNSDERLEGTVKWFSVKKGYGFITDAQGQDVFVHYRSIVQSGEKRRGLRDGQTVLFRLTDGEKGPQAEDVEAI